MTNIGRILDRVRQSVEKTSPGAMLMLYGSYARGDVHTDSDIDILVLVNTDHLTRNDKDAISFPLYDIACEEDVRISPKIYAVSEWFSKRRTPFMENVTREGVML